MRLINLDSLDEYTAAEINEVLERRDEIEMSINRLITELKLDPREKSTYLKLIAILTRKLKELRTEGQL